MKRIFISISIVAASIITACEQKPIIELPQTENGAYLFTLNANVDNDLTKTDYAGNSFMWSSDDQISVLFHNGTDNKFFTLTATAGGSNATSFSGLIDEGYEIGASDTGTQWALFPASESHSYSAGDTYPTFYIEPTKDYSESHYSADLPMISVGSEGVFSFKYLTGAYRFTFTDIDVNKVTLVVKNQESYFISGATPIAIDGSTYYLKHNYAFSEQPEHSLSFTETVSEGSATFYVPFKIWEDQFKPTLTLSDASTGYIIKQLKANKSVGDSYSSALGKVWIMPSISAPGMGKAFESGYGIPWETVTGGLPGASSGNNAGIVELKGYADGSYVYLLAKIESSRLLSGHKYDNSVDMYFGSSINPDPTIHDGYDWKWGYTTATESKWIGWIIKRSVPYLGDNIKSFSVGDYHFVEMRFARSGKSYLQTAGTAYLGTVIYYGKYTNEDDSSGTDHSNYMYAPSTNSGMLEVTMPDYVAP